MSFDLGNVLSATADGVRLRVKVVPGASRSRLAGLLGDSLKLAVAAPPEGGRANKAVCALLADVLKLPRQHVVITAGHAQPRKTIDLLGISLCDATERINAVLK